MQGVVQPPGIEVREYPCTPSVVSETRRWMRAKYGPLSYLPELVTSELATNCVRHAAKYQPGCFKIVCHEPDPRGNIRIEVYDGNPAFPERRVPTDDEETGRGLLLLDQLKVAWVAQRVGFGKVVICIIKGAVV